MPEDRTDPLLAVVEGGPEGYTALLATTAGRVLATVAGAGAGPEVDGAEHAAQQVLVLLAGAARSAGLTDPRSLRLRGIGAFVSGCELDEESDRFAEALAEVVEVHEVVVDDAALALLRAGTAQGEGVAVRCGAVTGSAAAYAGVRYRFPSLGRAGGEWGGSVGLGEEALWWAARAADGRGVPTSLERLAPLAVGHPSSASVARALRRGELSRWRLADIAPVVLRAAAAGDPVGQQLLERQAAELALTVHMALDRSGLLGGPAAVVLGGAVLQADTGPLMAGVRQRLEQLAPAVTVDRADRSPVSGALDLLLDHLEDSGRRAAGAAGVSAGVSAGRLLSVGRVRPPA